MKIDKNQIAQHEIAFRLGMAQMDAILKDAEIMELREKIKELGEAKAQEGQREGP